MGRSGYASDRASSEAASAPRTRTDAASHRPAAPNMSIEYAYNHLNSSAQEAGYKQPCLAKRECDDVDCFARQIPSVQTSPTTVTDHGTTSKCAVILTAVENEETHDFGHVDGCR